MNSVLKSLFILLAFFPLCVQGKQPCHSGTTGLAILKTTLLAINVNDPKGDLEKRVAHKDYRFLAVHGFALEHPGLVFPEDEGVQNSVSPDLEQS